MPSPVLKLERQAAYSGPNLFLARFKALHIIIPNSSKICLDVGPYGFFEFGHYPFLLKA